MGEALWSHAGVRDLARRPGTDAAKPEAPLLDDDSADDLPEADYSSLGSDGALRVQRVVSGVARNPIVREAVRRRAKNRCERPGCGAHRPYAGFIDVHHILGAENDDRYWTCVALCPNCHREAHMSPDRDAINAKLLEFAQQWGPKR